MAVRVCLLYVLFDPDMISWRERGPGQASLRTLLRLTPPSSLPPEARPQLPSAPTLQQWAASSRTGLARRAPCWGQQRGQAARRRATFLLSVFLRIFGGSPPPHTMSLLARAAWVQMGTLGHM